MRAPLEIAARYNGGDVAFFVAQSPHLALRTPAAAARFLRGQAHAGEECRAALGGYPEVLVDPLWFFYQCLRNLGALDRTFLAAVLADHGWRGTLWGAWLALLAPSEECLDTLRAAAVAEPRCAWLVGCAIAQIERRVVAPEHEPVVAATARIRRLLDGVAVPAVPLRMEPTAAERAQMTAERARIREIYARGGANAARAALPGTLVAFYAQDYLAWIRACGASPYRAFTANIRLLVE